MNIVYIYAGEQHLEQQKQQINIFPHQNKYCRIIKSNACSFKQASKRKLPKKKTVICCVVSGVVDCRWLLFQE